MNQYTVVVKKITGRKLLVNRCCNGKWRSGRDELRDYCFVFDWKMFGCQMFWATNNFAFLFLLLLLSTKSKCNIDTPHGCSKIVYLQKVSKLLATDQFIHWPYVFPIIYPFFGILYHYTCCSFIVIFDTVIKIWRCK